ncbi:MAG: GCN5 family acetyltransferase [Deltaproteobacteria bacterium SG8_13]|nr:MAG: GCN5 family acetyltransferase [Deltaproteobacteria bacterium SG8_13]
MRITYEINKAVDVQVFIELLRRSTLSERRPIDDLACIEGMLENSDLMVTAWHGQKLVGAARSVTDFHYCCYLSDLAVDEAYQKKGIGLKLQQLTREQLKERCAIILLAAPGADGYYGPIGYTKHERCWVIGRKDRLAPRQPRP